MHVPNHLLSPEVATVGAVAAVALIAVAISKVTRTTPRRKLPLVWALGAFVFAAQMVNFPIGTLGFSGHLVGGVLLASLLGPWLGFLTLSAVLTLQTLLFADGGLLALGWNIINMAAIGALVVYPLIFKPIVARHTSPARYFAAALASSVVAIVGGAVAVAGEAAASGIGSASALTFLGTMTTAHLAIGAVEGAVCGALLAFLASRQPALLESFPHRKMGRLRQDIGSAVAAFSLCALFIGGGLSALASEQPDGLEWSVENTVGQEVAINTSVTHEGAEQLQKSIALAPDYEGEYTGLIATAGILLVGWATSPRRRKGGDGDRGAQTSPEVKK